MNETPEQRPRHLHIAPKPEHPNAPRYRAITGFCPEYYASWDDAAHDFTLPQPLPDAEMMIYSLMMGDERSGDLPEWMDASQIAALTDEPLATIERVLASLAAVGAVEVFTASSETEGTA